MRNDYKDYIAHSAKGTFWKNHKYIKKINGKYYYGNSDDHSKVETALKTSGVMDNYKDTKTGKKYETKAQEAQIKSNIYRDRAEVATKNANASKAKADTYSHSKTGLRAMKDYRDYSKQAEKLNKKADKYAEDASEYQKISDKANEKKVVQFKNGDSIDFESKISENQRIADNATNARDKNQEKANKYIDSNVLNYLNDITPVLNFQVNQASKYLDRADAAENQRTSAQNFADAYSKLQKDQEKSKQALIKSTEQYELKNIVNKKIDNGKRTVNKLVGKVKNTANNTVTTVKNLPSNTVNKGKSTVNSLLLKAKKNK